MAHQLLAVWPRLESRLPVARLANLPTPVERLRGVERALGSAGAEIYVKRDDLTSTLYGGNKVRTLEVLLAAARARGATRVFATGAFGSNHAVATVLHAPRIGLHAGALLFPQPRSRTALENLSVTAAHATRLVALPHWSFLPAGMAWLAWSERRGGGRPFIMVPGGATPEGALGYVGAAFELATQVAAGDLPLPARIVIGVGSTCTSAGLLAGVVLAARLGVGFRDAAGRPAPPAILSVRVTPWPVTSRARILGLAERTAAHLARLTGEQALALPRAELEPHLAVEGRFLGRGYGFPTEEGSRATALFAAEGGPVLDTTYSSKSAAALLGLARGGASGPLLYWATKSSSPLPHDDARDGTPRPVLDWIARTQREIGAHP